jgi:hypothetical protein
MSAEELREIERWFTARGTPHLREGYSATEHVFTRVLPACTLILLLELGGALNAAFTWWQNGLAALGALAVLLGVWAAINRSQGRPALSRPARIGLTEVMTFVLVPGLLTAVIGGQPGQGFVLATVNALLLGGIYLVTSYGVVPLTRWALGKTARELGAVAGLLGRALPLLLVIQILLFMTTEMWQVADGFDAWFLGLVTALFFAIGVAFLLTRLPRELGRLATFRDVDEVRACVAGTPAEVHLGAMGDLGAEAAALSTRQRGNVMLVALFSQGLQVLLVTVLLGLFFVAFGLLTITPTVLQTWLGHPGDVLATFRLADRDVQLTAELLKFSAFLAAFSGLYFTVVLVTDATYREEFFDEILAELRQTLAVRVVYLRALGGSREV